MNPRKFRTQKKIEVLPGLEPEIVTILVTAGRTFEGLIALILRCPVSVFVSVLKPVLVSVCGSGVRVYVLSACV